MTISPATALYLISLLLYCPHSRPGSKKDPTGWLGINSNQVSKVPKEETMCESHALSSAMTSRGHHVLCFQGITVKDTPLSQDFRNSERSHPIPPPKQLSSNPAVNNLLYALQHLFSEHSSHKPTASGPISLSGNLPLAHAAVFPPIFPTVQRLIYLLFFCSPSYLIYSHEVI